MQNKKKLAPSEKVDYYFQDVGIEPDFILQFSFRYFFNLILYHQNFNKKFPQSSPFYYHFLLHTSIKKAVKTRRQTHKLPLSELNVIFFTPTHSRVDAKFHKFHFQLIIIFHFLCETFFYESYFRFTGELLRILMKYRAIRYGYNFQYNTLKSQS